MTKEFHFYNVEEIDSPSLLLYKSHLEHNIQLMLKMVGDVSYRLMPHIKTNKMIEVVRMMVNAGIFQFKAATIGECEIAAQAGAKSILLSHQLVGPKIKRFFDLINDYDDSSFWTIVDNIETVKKLNDRAEIERQKLSVFIDINNGMHRTGIEPGEGLYNLIDFISTCNNINFKGFHVYDGHLRNPDFTERQNSVAKDIEDIDNLYKNLKEENPELRMIVGGTPTFSIHADNENVICSPGTCVLWDYGYKEKLKEQNFKYAAILVTRIISKPTRGLITVDMGHKSVAPENPIDKRIKFLNLKQYELLSQSEEHGIIKVQDWDRMSVGDVLYGVPYHICPTINLHEYVNVIENSELVAKWKILRHR